jgi:hypothetical protein
MARTHKDLEFAVDDASGHQRTFRKFSEACEFAVTVDSSHGDKVNIDVLAYSRAGARAWAGDEGVEMYNEDPEASVFDRIEITANHVGRVA